MTIAIHQPHYLPWLGYFDKMDRADRFIFLDTVQFEKNGWQNRNRIKTATGTMWLTVPVTVKFGMRIDEVRIANATGWGKKQWYALVTNYSGTPFFEEQKAFFEDTLLRREWDSLVDLNLYTTTSLATMLGIRTESIRASDLGIGEDDPNVRLARICQAIGATSYIPGAGGRNYMDMDVFNAYGIHVEFQEYHHPVYPQRFGEFIPNLSAIDLLFNCGPESLNVMRQGRG
ncbi:MAG: WbqC family protein [Candidatus Latescibacteria bacterium]|nr:WbqC family protein [Candidatus Latescibacterota bacterium]